MNLLNTQLLSHIPTSWETAPVGFLADVRPGYPFSSDQFSLDAGTPLVRIRDLDKTSTEVGFVGTPPEDAWIDDGDLLIGMDGEFNVATWWGGKALLNQRMACVRARKVDARFLAYALPFPLKEIEHTKFSTTVKHLSISEIRAARIPLPPSGVQRAIATFLDRETAKIDTLIEKKRRLLDLLVEKRTALITRAVTRGLDPDVRMKESGVEGLGEIPAHWKVWKVAWLFSVGSGTTPTRQERRYFGGDVPWVTTSELRESVITKTQQTVTQVALEDYLNRPGFTGELLS